MLTERIGGQGHPPDTGGAETTHGATCSPPGTFSCVAFLHPRNSLIFQLKKRGPTAGEQPPCGGAHTFLSFAPPPDVTNDKRPNPAVEPRGH